MTKVQRKHTKRNLDSKRKRWLRNRHMEGQKANPLLPWQRRVIRKARDIPLRGVKADIPKSPPKVKRGFFAKLFRRSGV